MSEENTNTTVPQGTTAAPTTPVAPTVTLPAEGKVFNEEYVKSLREENKDYRLGKKAVEAKLKALLGLKEDEDVDDAKIAAYQAARKQETDGILLRANQRLILAEIKTLEGYDLKLVEALLDKSKLKIGDDGVVTGLKEAVEALAAEYPQIKSQAPANGANPPGGEALSDEDQLVAAYDAAMKAGDTVSAVSLKNKLFAIRNKK